MWGFGMDEVIVPEVLKQKSLTKGIGIVSMWDIRKYWTPQEIKERIDACRDPQDSMLLRFLWMSGVRITEAVSLRKMDIDFQNSMMKVRWLKSRKYKDRIVPIHSQLRPLLQLFTAPLNQEDLLFPYSRQRAWQICRKWMNGNPHMFRHSFAVNWLRNKGDIVILHKILGHSKIQTTMEYLKIVPVDQAGELQKIKFD